MQETIVGLPDDEQSRVVRNLMKHFGETQEKVLAGALTVALSMINATWPPETDDDEILYASCYQLFAYTLALASAVCDEGDEDRIAALWRMANAISVNIYGSERTGAAQAEAWTEYRGAVTQVAEQKRERRHLQ